MRNYCVVISLNSAVLNNTILVVSAKKKKMTDNASVKSGLNDLMSRLKSEINEIYNTIELCNIPACNV